MSRIVLYGFPRSTYVNVVRLVLEHKGLAYDFHDLETEMGKPKHLALHPFNRVPVLAHGDFQLYETAAIIGYLDDAFPQSRLTPDDAQARGRMNQWISALNAYYYPYIVYHLGHERLVFPALGIPADERVVAAAIPRINTALDVMDAALADGRPFLVGDALTLADYALTPTMTSLSRSPEGQDLLQRRAHIVAWRQRMDATPAVKTVMALVAPHLDTPIEHARAWPKWHRPRY
ncbi:MAG: glutathione S-transferase family protein [Hyphomonadaceae bacterium]